MTTMTEIQTTQVYQVFILATPEQIWEAITNSDFTRQYFYASEVEFANGRRIARGPNGELWGDEPVVEWQPPQKLVHMWRSQYDPELAVEETSRVTTSPASSSTRRCFITPKRVISSSDSSSVSVRPSRSKSRSSRKRRVGSASALKTGSSSIAADNR